MRWCFVVIIWCVTVFRWIIILTGAKGRQSSVILCVTRNKICFFSIQSRTQICKAGANVDKTLTVKFIIDRRFFIIKKVRDIIRYEHICQYFIITSKHCTCMLFGRSVTPWYTFHNYFVIFIQGNELWGFSIPNFKFSGTWTIFCACSCITIECDVCLIRFRYSFPFTFLFIIVPSASFFGTCPRWGWYGQWKCIVRFISVWILPGIEVRVRLIDFIGITVWIWTMLYSLAGSNLINNKCGQFSKITYIEFGDGSWWMWVRHL